MKIIKKFVILPTIAVSIGVFSTISSDKKNIALTGDYDLIRLKDGTTHTTSADYCLLTFDANGGSFKKSGTPTFQVRKGHNWARIKNKKGIPTENDLNKPASKEYKGWVDSDNKHISDYYVFNSDSVTFKAKWGDVYSPSTFATDSWDVFLQAADKGYDELKSKYESAYTYHKEGEEPYNTFVIQDSNDSDEVALKTRYVSIEGYKNPLRPDDGKWPVRVIGEDHDFIYGSFNEVATLTFEFTYALYPSISYDYTTSKGHQSWDDSSLKDYLNTYLYYQFEDALKNGIQYVDKNTNNGYGVGEISSSKDLLFVPSISEMSKKLDSQYSAYENSVYGYYSAHDDVYDLIKRNPFKLDGEGNPLMISTWVRSPNLSRGKNECKAYKTTLPSKNSNEITFELADTTYSAGVCPCFAVGLDNRVAYNFNGTGLGITPLNKFADTTNGFKGKIILTDESKYDLPTKENVRVKFIDKDSASHDLIIDDDFTYDDGTGELIILPKAITDNKGRLEISATPNSNLFKTDSWETLISVAENGIYGHKEGGGGMYERYGYDNYVGRYKYITINNKSYKCRVIGQGEDKLVEQNGRALLTFQFETVLGDDTLAFSNTDATNYTTSKLNNYLQQVSSYFPSGIKKVQKTVDLKEEGQGFGATTYETKLFPLSFSEMNMNASHPTDNEGEPYSYYTNEEYNPDKLKYKDNSKHEEVSHWLRSPATPIVADYIDIDGNLRQDVKCTDSKTNYVAPAFCIGVFVDGHGVEIHGENYTIQGWKPPSGSFDKFTSGSQLLLPGFKADENYTLNENSIKCKTRSDGKDFTDFTFTYDEAAKSWTASIQKCPDDDLIVAVAPEGCFKISLLNDLEDYPNTKIDVGFKNESSADVKFDYSTDGVTFNAYTFGSYVTLNATSPGVYFRAHDINEMLNTDIDKCVSIITANPSTDPMPELALSGNIMSLFDKSLDTTEFKNPFGVCSMFQQCEYIVDASSLILGGTSHSEDIASGSMSYFYGGLFNYCTNLRYAPFEINFEFKNNQCFTFVSMFRYCTSLVMSPTIKVNRLCLGIFFRTFDCCENLNCASDLIITDGENSDAYNAYYMTFNGCKNLFKGPSYIGKENIKTAEGCCFMTFTDCSNLLQASAFNFSESTEEETRIDTHCYGMYAGCEAMRTATINVKTFTEWGANHFKEMFAGCNSLTALYLTNLNNEEWDLDCFEDWLLDVDNKGYIYLRNDFAYALSKCSRGANTIPKSWGIRNIDTGEELR